MNFFNYYRITFVISFLVLLFGSVVKVSPEEFQGLNAEKILLAGFIVAFIYIGMAFFMIFKSKPMLMGEKLIWVVLFSAGLLFQLPIILFIVGLIFAVNGKKRLHQKA